MKRFNLVKQAWVDKNSELITLIRSLAMLQPDMLELTTQALVCLLQVQPALADQVPSLGHIPRLCRQMAVRNSQGSVYKAAILVLHQLATSEVRLIFNSPSL